MHPWFDRKRGLLDGDVGAFLYVPPTSFRWLHNGAGVVFIPLIELRRVFREVTSLIDDVPCNCELG